MEGKEDGLEFWVCVSVTVLYSEIVKVMVVVPLETVEVAVTARAVVVSVRVVSMSMYDITGVVLTATEVNDGLDEVIVVKENVVLIRVVVVNSREVL